MKKILTMALALVFLLGTLPGMAKADDDIKLWVDGHYVTTDVSPFIEDNRTLVPIRFVAEALGYQVTWSEQSQSVVLRNGSDEMVMMIGTKQATHNGKTTLLNKEPQIRKARTFLPIRDVAERFGRDIEWDQNNSTVVIGTGYTTPGPTPSPIQDDERLSAKDARKMVTDQFGGVIEKIEYTYDERNPHYKGEALKDGYKVVFEINARTVDITKWDVGNDNKWDDFAHELSSFITMDAAADKVIAQSGMSNTFVQKIDFKYDGNETIYQGEAFNKDVKFVFELYAKSGEFKKWSVSGGDETWAEQYANVR